MIFVLYLSKIISNSVNISAQILYNFNRHISYSNEVPTAGVTGDSKPLLCIQYAIKYRWRDSNPQNPDSKSGTYANSVTPAYQGAAVQKTGIEPVT